MVGCSICFIRSLIAEYYARTRMMCAQCKSLDTSCRGILSIIPIVTERCSLYTKVTNKGGDSRKDNLMRYQIFQRHLDCLWYIWDSENREVLGYGHLSEKQAKDWLRTELHQKKLK